MTEAGGQFTLLLVDDNPTNLTLLAKIVAYDLPQVRVLTAKSAREGLLLAERERIDGAFIDVQMPQMNGLEMCRRLKSNPRTAAMPLVLITAHLASPEMRAEGLEAGAYDFISQPVSNVEMLARIKVMLRLCQAEQQLRQDRRQLLQQVDDHSAQLRWVSGLLLSGDGPLTEPDQQLLQRLASRLPQPQELDAQQLVEKLTSEFPLPWRRTLCKLALLDEMPLILARRLSEITDIEAMLDYLQRHDLSLQPELSGDDRLHFSPPVKKILRERAGQILAEEDRQMVFLEASACYQQQEDYCAALDCLLRARQYPAVSQLLSQLGLILLLDRYQDRALKLLAQVPDDNAAGCGWLALFAGISRMQTRPEEVGNWLELARGLFARQADPRGELLTLVQLVRLILFLDGRLDLGNQRLPRLRELAAEQLPLLDPVNRVKVSFLLGLAELFFAGNLPRVEEIAAEALAETQQLQIPDLQSDTNLLRALLSRYQGRYRVARAVVEQWSHLNRELSRKTVAALALQGYACELSLVLGDLGGFRRQRQQIEQAWGGEAMRHSVFGALLGFNAALADVAEGEYLRARETIDLALGEGQAAFNAHLHSWLLQMRGWLNALANDEESALADLEKGLQLRGQAGGALGHLLNLLLAGITCLQLQRYEQAAGYLQQGLTDSQQLGALIYRGGFQAWLALLYLRLGRKTPAEESFTHLLELLQQQQVSFFPTLTPDLLRELFHKLPPIAGFRSQQESLASDWLGHELTTDGRLLPQLQLRTLGGFHLQLENRQLNLSEVAHSSRQILALLAAAPQRMLGTELLMAALWPDSPESKARSSFDTAHLRLRKTLQGSFGERIKQDYLVLEKGMLSLRHTRVDSHQFIAVVEEGRRQLQRRNRWQAEQLLWRAGQLWRGEFLAGYAIDGELPYQREKLTQVRLDQLAMLADLLRDRGEQREAIRLLQEGLSIDPLQDSLLNQLLQLLEQQGERQLARQELKKYRLALHAAEYSKEEIEELVDALLSNRFALEEDEE